MQSLKINLEILKALVPFEDEPVEYFCIRQNAGIALLLLARIEKKQDKRWGFISMLEDFIFYVYVDTIRLDASPRNLEIKKIGKATIREFRDFKACVKKINPLNT